MARAPDPGPGALARLAAAALLATALATACQDAIVNALIPLFRAWLVMIDDRYLTVDLALIADHGEVMLRRIATPSSIHGTGHLQIAPVSEISTQAAAGIALQPLILGVSLLFAWPWRGSAELACRLFAGAILLGVLVLLDVPLMLYGFAVLEESRILDTERFSPLVSWADAMNAGGRFALALVAVAASIRAGAGIGARLTARRWPWPQSCASHRPAPRRIDAPSALP